MSLPLSRYFALALALATVWVAAQDVVVGGAYLVAALGLLVPLAFFSVPRRFFFVMLFTAVAIFISYLLRPLVLVPFPEFFMYPNLGTLTPGRLSGVLVKLGAYSALMMGGIWLGFRFIPPMGAGEDPEPPETPMMVRAQLLVVGMVVVLLGIRAYLQFHELLFTKLADPNPTIGFASQLIPELMIYGVGVLYLFKYRRRIGPQTWWTVVFALLALVTMSLLSGSKGFLARIGATVFIYFLADRGDFELGPGRAALVGVASAWLLMGSFAVAQPLRPVVGGQGYGPEAFEALVEGTKAALTLDAEGLVYQGNAVTRRFAGLDGLLATEFEQPEALKRVFQPGNVAVRIAGRLIPKLDLGGSFTSGEAVGIYYSGHAVDVQHAGGVGLFGALRLTAGGLGSYGLAFILGVFWAAYFRATEIPRDRDLRLLLQLIGAMAIITWSMSGNFDVAITRSIVEMAHLFFYGGVVLFLAFPLQRSGGFAQEASM